MSSIKVSDALTSLLVPRSFKRENWEAFLYTPYSRKLSRRAYLYTPLGYDLWVHLESDPRIKVFNERVPMVPLTIGGGKAIIAQPDAISVDHSGDATVHEVVRNNQAVGQSETAERLDLEMASPWAVWANGQGLTYKQWLPSELRQNTIQLENTKRLLRWVCRPGCVSSPMVEEAVITELKHRRVTTWNVLFRSLGHFEPNGLSSAIVALVLDGRIYSDLHKFYLSQVTELSAFHEFD